jgi:hypothetical protein
MITGLSRGYMTNGTVSTGTVLRREYFNGSVVEPEWSPAELFLNGEQGGYYDVSDLATLFQDTAGTQPVTADGQVVNRINDLSGGDRFCVGNGTGTTSSPPIYKTDGLYHWLEPIDGTPTTGQSRLSSVASGVGVRLQIGMPMSLLAGCEFVEQVTTTLLAILSISEITNTTQNFFNITHKGSANSLVAVYRSATLGGALSAASYHDSIDDAVVPLESTSLGATYGNGFLQINANGEIVYPQTATPWTDQVLPNGQISIGIGGAGDKLYAAIVVNRELTIEEAQYAKEWINKRMPTIPINTVLPNVTGNPQAGSVLTCSTGTWNPTGTFAYQWLDNNTPIIGQTNNTITLNSGYIGRVLSCRVSCTNSYGTESAISNDITILP